MLKSRSYKIELKDVDTFDIETGEKQIKKRFRFPCHGDIVNDWIISIPYIKGYKSFRFKNFKFYINDNLLNNVKGIEHISSGKMCFIKINIEKLRNELRSIDMPDTKRNNTLINIENQFMNQSLECLRVPLQQNVKVEPMSKEIMINNLFMGGICIEFELVNYPVKEIVIVEQYYDYMTTKLKEKDNEIKKAKTDHVSELFNTIKNS